MFQLYQMIWQRFVASQMVPAVFDQTTIDIAANDYTFRATGSVIKFDGYLAAYQAVKEEEEKEDEGDTDSRTLPHVTRRRKAASRNIRPDQHFTEPPPRYTEATLVKELEEKGIGRPSTYAAIISTIVEREYVNKDQGRFTPTLLGEKVSDLLVKASRIFSTWASRRAWKMNSTKSKKASCPGAKSVQEFWDRFEVDLDKAADKMESYKAGIPTGKKCEKCGQGELLERISRHGFFLGCSRYPECDFTQDLAEHGSADVEEARRPQYCDNCGKEMVIKRGRFGTFLACTGYPNCKTTRRLVTGTKKAQQPDVPIGEKCPDVTAGNCCAARDASAISSAARIIRSANTRGRSRWASNARSATKANSCAAARPRDAARGRIFYGCSRYPDCDFTTPHEPINEPCPKCGAPFIVEKRTKQGNFRACISENCDWEVAAPEPAPFVHPQEPPSAEPQPVGAGAPSKS